MISYWEATFSEDELFHNEDIYRRATFQNSYFYKASNISQQLPFQKSIFLRKSIFSRTYFSRDLHCVKSVPIRSFSSPYFPAFGLNTDRLSVSLRIQSECRKIWIRITPNTDSFYSVLLFQSDYFFKNVTFPYHYFFTRFFFRKGTFFHSCTSFLSSKVSLTTVTCSDSMGVFSCKSIIVESHPIDIYLIGLLLKAVWNNHFLSKLHL